jgi:hypothetical protein
MRIMNLPGLSARRNSVDECVGAYLERLPGDNALWPDVSALLTAYLCWPNNEERRNSFVATCLARLGIPFESGLNDAPVACRKDNTFEMFGGMDVIASVAFEQLSCEIGQVQRRWLLVADIFQSIVDMAYDHRTVLRGGPSISKAIDLCECEQGLPGHSQLRAAWSEFRDVAHLLVAGAYLAHQGLARATADAGSILKGIWIAPDGVLALAYGFQEFGLEEKPIKKEGPFLTAEGLWRVSDSNKPATPFIVHRRLSETQLAFLSTRRASKEYIPSAAGQAR